MCMDTHNIVVENIRTFLIATLLLLVILRINKISEKQGRIIEAINHGVEIRSDIIDHLISLQEVDSKLVELDSLIVNELITK